MKWVLTLFASLLVLGLAVNAGLPDWQADMPAAAARAQAALPPEAFTVGGLLDGFSRLPSPWATIARWGFVLTCGLLLLGLAGAVLRALGRTVQWVRDLVA